MLRPSWCGMRLCRGGGDESGGRSSSDTDDRGISFSGCHPSASACTAGEGDQDVAAFQKYAEEVDLYVKACQHYIDGATNDANAIIEARNKAVKKAQEAVDVYNRFFDK